MQAVEFILYLNPVNQARFKTLILVVIPPCYDGSEGDRVFLLQPVNQLLQFLQVALMLDGAGNP